MASSRRMLAAAVVAALVAVAWCAVPPVSITVEKGTDEKNMALNIKYDKDGDSMKEVELKQNEDWLPLTKSYSGVWEMKSATPLKAPYSFRYETEKGQRNVFDDIVPADYKIGATYKPEEPDFIKATTIAAPVAEKKVFPGASSSSVTLEQANADEVGAVAVVDSQAAQEPPKPPSNRCLSCRKKVGLTGFQCRCGGTFCSMHRYADSHECSFDYKTAGREQIAKQNPVVIAEKINKI